MGIIEIEKTEKVGKKDNNNTTKSEELSLNNLNHKGTYKFDFSENKNPEMAYGKLKTERGIVRTILSTLINVLLFTGVTIGIIYAVFKFSGLSFVLFNERSYYTLEYFNSELGRCLLTLFILLLISCFLCAFYINLSIRIRFRKAYLSSNNVYVYDVFLVLLNILLFVLIGVVFFLVINNYNSDFTKWYTEQIVSPEVKLEIIDVFKYVVVIVIAVFISLNTLRGIHITYEKNRFIFENHL